jgi:hypothetical protein
MWIEIPIRFKPTYQYKYFIYEEKWNYTQNLYHMKPCCKVQRSARFLVLQEVAELADGPTGCGEQARGGCLFAWNFSMTRLVVFTEV